MTRDTTRLPSPIRISTRTPDSILAVVCTTSDDDKGNMILEFDFPQMKSKDRLAARNIILISPDGEIEAETCIAENAFLREDLKNQRNIT